MDKLETMIINKEESGMRLDRWFKKHFSGLAFGNLQKMLRSGQIRIDGGRAKSHTRIVYGQRIRIPPVLVHKKNYSYVKPVTRNTIRDQHDRDVLDAMLIYKDNKVLVFNKPPGLAVQGGSGINRHLDGMLESYRSSKGEKPRLIHRLDRDTSGVIIVARTRSAAVELAAAFRKRNTEKIYWAICCNVPRQSQGHLSTYVRKEQTPDGDRMRVLKHMESGCDHAVSEYKVVETAGKKLSWLRLRPITGRTHQLRVHMAHIGCPIIGDGKYFNIENWKLPGGIQNSLHLHAKNLRIPHPDREILDVTAPLPQHMMQTWNLLGFNPHV